MNQPVSREQLMNQLQQAVQHSWDHRVGLYGPDSMMWQVGKEAVGFSGGGRAALLQLAHPWVANAIKQHSQTQSDPIGRFHRTFTNVFTMLYGNVDQVVRVAHNVHHIHSRILGEIEEQTGAHPKGEHYMANEVNAMLWVHATLWDTSVMMYELLVRPLKPAEKEKYYQETTLFAYLFGIPDDALPPNWHEFMEYNQKMWNSDELAVAAAGYELGEFLFKVEQVPLSKIALPWLKIFTAGVMPIRLREAFGLPTMNKKNQYIFEQSVRWIKLTYPLLPKRVRYVPAYVEAQRRLKGIENADMLTKALNKVWVGKAELVSNSVK